MGNKSKVLGGGLAACLALATPCTMYFEGMVAHTYADVVGVPTNCYGHTGADVKFGQSFTESQCRASLGKDLQKDVRAVETCVAVDLQPWEAAALVDFVHNVGEHALCTSTLARMLNNGAPPDIWCPQLLRWDKATKMGVTITLPGLTKRRHTEYELCLGHGLPTDIASTQQ